MGKKTELPASVNVTRAVKEITTMSAAKAEKAVEAIADREGDELAKDILKHLPPVKIAAILRQHDFSCPSIISWIMTPELIVEVVKVAPLFWKQVYNRYNPGNFPEIQGNALDLVTSLLLNAKDREQQGVILHQLSDDGLALHYLMLPFVGWEIQDNQTLEFEDPEIDFGTADHLFEMIRWAAPFVAQKIILFVQSAKTSLIYYLTDLWLEAFHDVEKGHDVTAVENVMFLPID